METIETIESGLFLDTQAGLVIPGKEMIALGHAFLGNRIEKGDPEIILALVLSGGDCCKMALDLIYGLLDRKLFVRCEGPLPPPKSNKKPTHETARDVN